MSESHSESAKQSSNDPKYHHYVPQFYLSRWATTERKICRFSKPYDRIVPKMVGLRRTGGQDSLYELKSVAPEHAQWIEMGPMWEIDTYGSQALDLLEAGNLASMSKQERSNWSRFLMSMMMRGPDDIELIRKNYAAEWQKDVPEIIEKLQGSENKIICALADKVPEMLAADSPLMADWALEMAVELMDHTGIGGLLNNLIWMVREVPEGVPELLTSDRPIMASDTMILHDDYILMPIGPRKLFLGVTTPETEYRVSQYDIATQVAAVNRFIVGQAQEQVYGTDDAQLEFVREHMSKRPRPSLFERLVRFRELNPSM
ncbi:DUF4238 domain-containing protein [Rhizobium laguerreae]